MAPDATGRPPPAAKTGGATRRRLQSRRQELPAADYFGRQRSSPLAHPPCTVDPLDEAPPSQARCLWLRDTLRPPPKGAHNIRCALSAPPCAHRSDRGRRPDSPPARHRGAPGAGRSTTFPRQRRPRRHGIPQTQRVTRATTVESQLALALEAAWRLTSAQPR